MRIFLIALFATSTLMLSSCGDGPAEEAGEELDNAVEDAAEDVEDALDG